MDVQRRFEMVGREDDARIAHLEDCIDGLGTPLRCHTTYIASEQETKMFEGRSERQTTHQADAKTSALGR